MGVLWRWDVQGIVGSGRVSRSRVLQHLKDCQVHRMECCSKGHLTGSHDSHRRGGLHERNDLFWEHHGSMRSGGACFWSWAEIRRKGCGGEERKTRVWPTRYVSGAPWLSIRLSAQHCHRLCFPIDYIWSQFPHAQFLKATSLISTGKSSRDQQTLTRWV